MAKKKKRKEKEKKKVKAGEIYNPNIQKEKKFFPKHRKRNKHLREKKRSLFHRS